MDRYLPRCGITVSIPVGRQTGQVAAIRPGAGWTVDQ